MEYMAIKDFEQFCEKNGVKPTNMKAEYYLAGHYKGEERIIDKACDAYCNAICKAEQTSGKRCSWRLKNERCPELEFFVKVIETE